MKMPKTSKQKTDTRKALMTAAAREDGFFDKHGKPSWSYALTLWLRREARLVRVDELRAHAGRAEGDGQDGER